MNKKLQTERIRCNVCGKYIAYKDIYLERSSISLVLVDYTPNTVYTQESITFYHKKCLDVNTIASL